MEDIRQLQRYALYLLFAISGFSGLIYESIWSHYLKLFLGHAAYAQTLVLAIYMGGMAFGAWIPSRYGVRWKNLLLAYALVEGVIGIGAFVFHSLFVTVTDTAYDSLIPALGSTWSISLMKWGVSVGLILPQTILLGMTFPLMTASLIRRHSSQSGRSIATLYFANSLGASIGVLISGYALIKYVGLPGTIHVAGLINICVALIAGYIAYIFDEKPLEAKPRGTATQQDHSLWRPMLLVAFLTGAASFIYELGWIRMLSMVLGASTHSFELMLSAFILGIALGGFWIRRRIDGLTHPLKFLGWVQVIMGLLAMGTLIAYNASFDLMHLLIRNLAATASGYFLFNLGSQSIAMLIMVPVTFCAGMTLPLITHTLLREGHGEKSIGAVYVANTAGAIVGIFFAIHIGFTTLGLKGLIVAGATLDVAVGVALLGWIIKGASRRPAYSAVAVFATVIVLVLGFVTLDSYKMASGVFRHGRLFSPANSEIIYHKDGKTATVELLKERHERSGISITTNGKVDARIVMDVNHPPSSDESTMILAGSLPLIYNPGAKSAANIGIGSGLTTHVLLNSPTLGKVDTIEIEPAMIEAANGFRPRVELAFSDPRSHFHIDDAKSYFSANRSRYDIIVSEPSNPWVSGVSNLFTDEFYRRVRTYLNPGGVFVQWLNVYEMEFNLVASVMKAIGKNFSDYVLYAANDGDLLILAVPTGEVPKSIPQKSIQESLAQVLQRVRIKSIQDIWLRRIGERKVLEPLFASSPATLNSDFYPYLDLNAVRARYLKASAIDLALLRGEPVPAMELLSGERITSSRHIPDPSDYHRHSRHAHAAGLLHELYSRGAPYKNPGLAKTLFRHAMITLQFGANCTTSVSDIWIDSVQEIMNIVTPYLSPSEMNVVWQRLQQSACVRQLSHIDRDVFNLLGAVSRRDSPGMAKLAEKLLREKALPTHREGFLLSAGMLGFLTDNKPEKALELWKTHARRIHGSKQPSILHRLLWSHSYHRVQTNKS